RPDLDPDAVLALELVVEVGDRLLDFDGGARGSKRVVLVDRRHAEYRHHGVADELLDRSAVPTQHAGDRVEVTQHHPAERLRVDTLGQSRRVSDVDEDDGYGLAKLVRHRSSVRTTFDTWPGETRSIPKNRGGPLRVVRGPRGRRIHGAHAGVAAA